VAARYFSVDIETSGNQITRIGFAPRPDLALVVPIHDSRTARGSYWPTAKAERSCWELIRQVLEDQSIPKLFQNGMYDFAFILRTTGIKTLGCAHDTMLLHHALQPESLKAWGSSAPSTPIMGLGSRKKAHGHDKRDE